MNEIENYSGELIKSKYEMKFDIDYLSIMFIIVKIKILLCKF